MTPAKKSAKKPSKAAGKFSDFERSAMKDRVKELKAEASGADGTKIVLDRIAQMPEPDRTMATRIHEIVMAAAPELSPRTWYGMPAYAKNDKVVCFFQDAKKFKARYATLGFSDQAKLDDGNIWPTSFALSKLTAAEEAKISALVKQAVR
jgi:uncharacterized protein YdhG (YjbR/CyaY superfamily)